MVDQVAGDPDARVYIDGEPFDGAGAAMTGAQLLALAGRDPGRFALFAEGHHGQRIGAEHAVPIQDGSRFVTQVQEDAQGR